MIDVMIEVKIEGWKVKYLKNKGDLEKQARKIFKLYTKSIKKLKLKLKLKNTIPRALRIMISIMISIGKSC